MNKFKNETSAPLELKAKMEVKVEEEIIPQQLNFFQKIKNTLASTSQVFVKNLVEAVAGAKELDDDAFDNIEEILLTADIGVQTTRKILNFLEAEYSNGRVNTPNELLESLKKLVLNIFLQNKACVIEKDKKLPTTLLFIGINGVGKTTTIGKIASRYLQQEKKVLLAAGDTFRAAGIEQLQRWGTKINADVFARDVQTDPSATFYQAAQKAVQEHYDYLLCDTSGRIHTNQNLMFELKKMKAVLGKVIPQAPHYTFLIVDATTGQNMLHQAREFHQLIGINGLIVTKLDGTSKAGILVGLVNEFKIPIFYVGIGEKAEDLYDFNPHHFCDALFSKE